MRTSPRSRAGSSRSRPTSPRVAAGTTATAPVALPLTFDLSLSALPAEQIFELTCAFTFARTGGIAEGEFAAVAGILSATTMLQPAMPATKAQQNGSPPGLATFASNFETAYTQTSSTLKVAVGPNRFDAGVASSSTLWAVQVGAPKTPISFAVEHDATGPLIFAPQPITNQLVSKPAGIWPYTSGTAIDFTQPPAYTKSFTDIDLDQWVRLLFAAVDELLGPQYIAALIILDQKYPGTLAALQQHKKNLAAMYAQQMALVFTDQSGANTAVAAMFTQAMYEQLGNAYLTQAALQYTADIYAGVIDDTPPNLYGPVTQTTSAVPGVAFTPAKIPLQPPTNNVPQRHRAADGARDDAGADRQYQRQLCERRPGVRRDQHRAPDRARRRQRVPGVELAALRAPAGVVRAVARPRRHPDDPARVSEQSDPGVAERAADGCESPHRHRRDGVDVRVHVHARRRTTRRTSSRSRSTSTSRSKAI